MILELASHYTPGSESEVFELLNALEDRLNHVNSAVVVAAIKVFLHLTLSMTATHQQVIAMQSRAVAALTDNTSSPPVYALVMTRLMWCALR